MTAESQLAAGLRRLRTARGLSQQAVAELAGLSRVGYREIETGKVTPRLDSLERIAGALEVTVPQLLAPVRQLTHVRFRAAKRMSTRDNLLTNVARWLDDFQELEELLDERIQWPLEGLATSLRRSRKQGLERARWAAAEARKALGLESDDEPIRDLCGLLEDRGIKVLPIEVKSEGFFGLSVGREDAGPAVVVNVWDRVTVERWIFTSAHELAHLLLYPGAYDVTQTEEQTEEEKQADEFASYFLMPDAPFQKEWQESRGLGFVDRVFKIKRIFRVSWQTVVYRVASPFPRPEREALWERFYADYERQTGSRLLRSTEPDGLEPADFTGRPAPRVADEPARLDGADFKEDRLSRLVRAAIERELISMGRAAEILGLALMDMRQLTNSWVG